MNYASRSLGCRNPSHGTIYVEQTGVNHKTPDDAVRNGVFLIPGDRRTEGQISDENVAFNTTLSNL